MKKLGNLKLNYLAKSELDSQEMNLLVGGQGNCCCSCWAYGKGGSSDEQNDYANNLNDLRSIYGCDGGDGGDSGDSGIFGDHFIDVSEVLTEHYCSC